MSLSKNHTISKIVAKAILRLTVIIMAAPIIIYFTDSGAMNSSVSFPSAWSLLFPILLLLTFVTLLIAVLKNKYMRIDLNWLMSLSGGFTCLYLIMFYARVLNIFN